MTAKKKRVRVVFFLILSALFAAAVAEAGVVNKPAPGFTLPDGAGAEVSLDDFAGRVVFLDFWASWCPPCKEEMPELKKLAARYSPEDLVVVAANIDKARSNADRFLSTLGPLPEGMVVLYDPAGDVIADFRARAMPTSFIIDGSGTIRYVHFGFRENDPAKWTAEIDALIKEGAK